MKNLLVVICFLLLGLTAGSVHFAMQTEMHAARWERRVQSVSTVERLNMQVARSREYSESCFELAKTLTKEYSRITDQQQSLYNTICEYDEENRSLKASLSESVKRLEAQEEQISDLIQENNNLIWKIETLEAALDRLNNQTDLMEVPCTLLLP
jgi:vacuolar-type H+-ATPase subunit I/STV1